MPRPPSQTIEQFNPALADQLVDQSLRSLARGSSRKVQWRCPTDPRHVWWASPMNRTAAKNPTGCSVCKGRTVIAGVNDVATTHPDAAALIVDPHLRTSLTASSNKRVAFWCGDPTHEHWIAPVSNVVRQNTRCPQCSGRVAVKNQTDLATTHPALAAQLVDPSLATSLSAGSNRKVTWHCTADHTWEASVYSRTAKRTGCPYCAGRLVIPGATDLATTHPALAAQLVDPSLATSLSKGSDCLVQWQCPVNPEHTWSASPSNRVKPSGCPLCYAQHRNQTETHLADLISQLVPHHTVVQGDRSVLPSGKELDIVVPDLHLAIEYNGVFWHSEAGDPNRSTQYHRDKTREARTQGYQLIHVWEDSWRDNPDLVLRALAHRLHAPHRLPQVAPDIDPLTYQRISARCLTVTPVSGPEARRFWQDNHLQGPVGCSVNLGLRDDDGTLRALLGIGRKNHGSRVTPQPGTWDIQRYATRGIIPGGFTRLLAHAERELPVIMWTSWSDDDVSNGAMYCASGFERHRHQPASYSYVGPRTGWRRVHRSNYTKQRFIDDPCLVYRSGQTEHEAALVNQLYRIYDAGKTQWVKHVA